MDTPLISVIIPCYNYAHHLTATIESVRAQTLQDWECIIIDDGSTDGTPKVAERYVSIDRRFRYYYQQNRGLPAARNEGLAKAKGTFVQFLDADDIISSEKLSLQSAFMISRPEVQISYTDAFYFLNDRPKKRYRSFYFDDNGMPQVNMDQWIPRIDGRGADVLNRLVRGNIAPVHCMLTRKELIDKIGGFDESLKYLEDWDFWFRCAMERGVFSYFGENDALAFVRVHPDSMSNSAFNMLLQHFRLLKRWEYEIGVRAITGVNFNAPEFMLTYHYNLRKLFRMSGFSNIRKLKQIARVFGWSEFLKLYFSYLN